MHKKYYNKIHKINLVSGHKSANIGVNLIFNLINLIFKWYCGLKNVWLKLMSYFIRVYMITQFIPMKPPMEFIWKKKWLKSRIGKIVFPKKEKH